MTDLLITNVGELTTNVDVPGDPCGTITDGALLIRDGRVAWVGRADDAPGVEDAATVSYTHLTLPTNREV